MAQVDQRDRTEWVVGRVESLVADIERLERERSELSARVDEQSGLERQRDELHARLERVVDEQSELERERDELNEAFGRLTRAVSRNHELTDGSEHGTALSTEVFYSRDEEEAGRELPTGAGAAAKENGAPTATDEPTPARGRRFASQAEPVVEEPPEPNGGVAAAILAAAGGCATLGLLVVAAELSAGIEAALTLYEPAGALTGKTTVPVVLWLVAWPVLSWLFRDARMQMQTVSRIAFALVGIGLICTFPPFYQLFTLH